VPKLLRFDCYDVDLAGGQVYRRGTRLRIPDQAFRVLGFLLERAGRAVTREELRDLLWPDGVFVDHDNSLNTAVARLREALHDSADHARFIETLPKRGYRFIAQVCESADAQPAEVRRSRLLVLPFVNLTGDPAQEYVSDAFTEELITQFAMLAPDSLAVIARTTAMRYKGSRKDVARIGHELRVEYVVEGTIRSASSSLAVNTQLVRVDDQSHLWAQGYDAEPADVFAIAAVVARTAAGSLGLGRAEGRDSGARRPEQSTRDPVAYKEYVQGHHCFDRHVGLFDGFEKAREHLEAAVARDPGFVLAREALAHVYWFLGYLGIMAPKDAFGAGIMHAVRVLEIDNKRAETRAILAPCHKLLDYKWPEIERELSLALELDPVSPVVRMLYAVNWLMPQARLDEAVTELEGALELDPLSYHMHLWLGVVLVLARDWQRAAGEARLLIELEPESAGGPWLMGVALRGRGVVDESVDAHRKAVDLSRGAPMMLGWLGLVLGSAGRTDEARSVLDRLEETARTRYVPASAIAWVCLGLRDVEGAFEWMDRAVEARDQFMMPIKTYAFLDPLRSDPRFAALLRKMRLDS
jgi:TolB-like protein/tetratricopeptide (TPR) repeat protein